MLHYNCRNANVNESNAVPSGCAVCGRLPAEIVGSNPSGDMDGCLL